MSVRKRGAGWVADVKVGQRRTRCNAATRAEAREAEARIRAELLAESNAAPVRSLESLLLEHLKRDAAAHRDQKGLKTSAKALRPYLTGQPLDEAPAVAGKAKAGWQAAGLAPATINRRLALLRRMCNVALEWGWTDKPLGKRIKLLPERNERHVYLTADEVGSLAAAMPLVGDAVILAAYTGLRLAELMRLTQANVDGDDIVLYRTKTDTPRRVPVPARARHILKKLPWQWTETVRRNEWDAARKACQLEHVHWHDLRHTYASFLAAAGFSDREMGELLGHTSAQMVRRYAHLLKPKLAQRVSGL